VDKRVLIVDDDPAALRLLKRHLQLAGIDVLTARDGREAMHVALWQAPSIVIADWEMPVMDGVQLCRQLREHEGIGFVYTIILTANDEQGRVVEALDAGADDYLVKPFAPEELLARLRAGQRIVNLEANLAQRNRQVFKYNAKLAITNETLAQLATTDELTGLINRRAGMARLHELWSSSRRYGEPLSYVVLDIDHFKNCNDTYGHGVGDIVLKRVADIFRKTSRLSEVVCRFGGEEFLIICPKSVARMAGAGAERVRQAVESLIVKTDAGDLRVTISAGVAEMTKSMVSPDHLLRVADQALYLAKRSGRNRVVVSGDDQVLSRTRRQRATSASDTATTEASDDPIAKTRTAVVVDEHQADRYACRRLLEEEGFSVIESVGRNAVSLVGLHQPDLVIVNTTQQELDGATIARLVRSNPATNHVPILMTGAVAQGSDIEAGLECDVDEFIAKPFNPTELMLRVRSMTRRANCERELLRIKELYGEQARTMTLLLDLAQRLCNADTLDRVLEHIISVTAEITCSRRVSVLLRDGNSDTLRIASSIGMERGVADKIRVPIGGATSGRVFATGEPLIANSVHDAVQCRHDYDSECFASMPLVSSAMGSNDNIVGVLNITERHGDQPFSPCDLEYIDLVCNIAASAIEEIVSREARDQARDSIVVALAKLAEHRDGCTGKHLDRVTQFSLLLARELAVEGPYRHQIDAEFLSDLKRAVPLHDIGKVGIPDRILLKAGKLSAQEKAIMETHTQIGTETIRSVAERVPGARFLEMASDICHCHHERFDGSGYPRGIGGTEIPISARIAALADVYDALRSERPYKRAFSHEETATEIRDQSGRHFDPTVVEAFVKRMPDFAALSEQLADHNNPNDLHDCAQYAERAAVSV